MHWVVVYQSYSALFQQIRFALVDTPSTRKWISTSQASQLELSLFILALERTCDSYNNDNGNQNVSASVCVYIANCAPEEEEH